MRIPTIADLDSELAEVLKRRTQALDLIERCMQEIVSCDYRADVLLDRRASLTFGVPVATNPR